ncbi:MAG TPA: rod shape-determining protein MreC [Thermoanaerobaculia bacterium]|nr:rod shape-determining protein MreC [Thermoanaerobaculia bacterium]
MDERRTGWLLVLLLVGQLVFLVIQGGQDRTSDTVLERWGLRVLGPAARTVASVPEGFSGAREGLRLRGSLLEENRRLRREVEDLKLRLLRLSDIEQEMRRLGSAVRYAAPPAGRIRAVDIIYADHSSWLRTLLLYTGGQPSRVNQPVLSPSGLVGRVVSSSGPYAKVQLITDRAASVGAMLLRTRRQGVVRGSGRGSGLVLDYVPLQTEVRPGDMVVTAGIDGVYPRGIPVGTVIRVEQGGQLFHHIELAAAVDFGALDQVYLLENAPAPRRLLETQPGGRP